MQAHAKPPPCLRNLPNNEYKLGVIGDSGKPEMKPSVRVPQSFDISNHSVSEFYLQPP